MKTYNIELLPGDGIGVDVIKEAEKVLDTLEKVSGDVKFKRNLRPWGCKYYLENGEMMPKDAISILSQSDAILLGAVGFPGVPDNESLWGMLLPIRQEFDQYINVRPVKLLEGMICPLANKLPGSIDFTVIRENTEGEYSGLGGRSRVGTAYETAIQTSIFTKHGTERVIRYAFELAKKSKRNRLTSVTKSNALNYSMVFWDDVTNELAKKYPEVDVKHTHVDAMSAFMVTKPEEFDVIVASNLFGDILTDLGSALMGSIGVGPSANLNPEKKYPSMFEPIHGSAPDIAGKGIGNPIGTIWSVKMMLEHLGEQAMADLVMKAIEDVCKNKVLLTPDMHGKAKTWETGDAINKYILEYVK